ncbi:MAG: hypothetical protein AMS16_00920 [Planctomycetes bacterium DG_58]|nr:MAG: hypothetical protein AMS16_00920 [Planctomycetes bacterium DG_58]
MIGRKKLICAVAVVVVLVSLGAAGGDNVPEKTVHLSVWELPRPEDTSIAAKCDRAVIRAFRKKYPTIQLSSPTGISIPEMQMDTRPLMAIAGDVSPDVIYVNFRQSDTYIQEGFLYPLDEWVKEMPKAEYDERVLPQVEKVIHRWGPGKKTGQDPEKHYWALPYGNYVKGLVWRKDLFHEAGLDPERGPETWDEYYEFARRCTNPEKGTFGILMRSHSWYFYSILVSAGARAMEDVGEDEWAATFNTPEAVRAYEFILKLLQQKWRHSSGKVVEGVAYSETEQASTLWGQGRIAMQEIYFRDFLLADINPELLGIAPVPASPDGRRASELNCTMCGIFTGAAKKGREVLEAAWRYVHFIGSFEAKAIRTRVQVENGYGMFCNPAYLEKLGYTDYLRRIPKGWREVFDEAMTRGEAEPYGRNCQQVYKYMTNPADRMLLDKLGHVEWDAVEAARERLRRDRPDITDAELETELAKVRTQARARVRARIQEILNTYVRRANEKMIGRVAPREMLIRRLVGWTVAVAIALAFAALFRYVWKVFRPVEARGGWLFRKYWIAYVILIPAVATIALWRYVPMVRGAMIAFQDYHIVHLSEWVGIDNFANVLWEDEFWRALKNSLWYVTLAIALGFFAPIFLAVLLHEVPKGKIAFRTIYYLPAVLSGLVVMLMWKNFFDPSERGLLNQVVTGIRPWMVGVFGGLIVAGFLLAGYFNWRSGRRLAGGVLAALGVLVAGGLAVVLSWVQLPFAPRKWLGDPGFAMFCVILPTVWAGMGPGCLIYLAALKTIPEEIYEAADIDGAGFLGKLRHITIPSIKVLILINFIGAVVNAFRVSGYILAMTGGGPEGATEVLALKIFFDAFVFLRFGVATATAWILGAMLIGFTVFQLRRLSRVEFRTAGQ